jgi:hypothetical protein
MRLYSLIAILFCSLCYGCTDNKSDTTPVKYRNHTTVTIDVYKKHMLILQDSIIKFIKEKSHAYYPKENDLLTEVIIDTILYSPQKDKVAFFVITKNSDDKLLGGGNKTEYHYDAHCFIADLKNNSFFKNIFWIRASSLSNYKNLNNAHHRIREMYFKDFSERKDGNNNSMYKYNLDDIRFWDGPLWQINTPVAFGEDTIVH